MMVTLWWAMSHSDRKNWTIDDWRNYALELEKILERKPKKSGRPRKHPKDFVGAVIYRIVLARLEGNKLTANKALEDELEKRGKGRWRAKNEYRAILNEVSNRKDLHNKIEALLIHQKEIDKEVKLINERLELIKDNRRIEATQPCLADVIRSESPRVKKS